MLEDLLGSKTKVRLLRLLVAHPEREFSTREVSLAIGQSVGTVHPALRQLWAVRAILARQVGRSRLVRLNRAHPLAQALGSVFRQEASALTMVAVEFAEALPRGGIKAAVLFGSVARGEPTARSDVDVLVVVDDPRKAAVVERTAASMLDRYDANVSPLVLTSKDVGRRLASFDPLLQTIAAEGRLLRGRAAWLGR